MPSGPLVYWLLFIVVAAVIAVAGPHVSRNGDIIAERTGMTGSWVGIVLIATVTSLPELATGSSAVLLWDLPDIAVGDVLGSCVFNLMILMVVDFMLRGAPVYSRANAGHIITAGFGVVLAGFAAISLLLATSGLLFPVWHIGASSIVMVLLYVAGVRAVFTYERTHHEEHSEDVVRRYPDVTVAMACRRYAVAAAVIVAAGIALPFVGNGLAETMGWNRTFVGTLLVAAATSLPELAVTIAAVRMGALNMAVAGLLGSNMFNMVVLAVEDAFYFKGPILAAVSPTHAVSAVSAVIMTGLFVIGLQYRPPSKLLGLAGWISIVLFIIYLFNSYVMYLHGH
jgi:cation:H+ antiporter